jgi:signal transduction histidine kinase
MPNSPLNPGLLIPGEAPQTRHLLSQVAWFNRLRIYAAAGVVWGTALATHVIAVVEQPWPLYSLGALIALVDGGYMLYFPTLSRLSIRHVRRHVFSQITIDLLILTTLLHFTGGVTNPLLSFYLFHAFIAALVLSEVAGFAVGAMSLVLVCGLAFGERSGLLSHHPLSLGLVDLFAVEPLGFALVLFAFATTLACSVYFVAQVLRRLRAGEAQLIRMGRHLALSEKLASIGTLAAGVSHEINNPVGVIANKVQVLRYRVQDGDEPQKLLLELDVVEKHARRIGQITAGLLAFSRETPFELRSVDVAQLVREAVDLVRVPFRSAQVELRVSPGDAVTVLGSTNHLLQVLINILLNAKDASSVGREVELRWEHLGSEAAISIVDEGTGIPPDVLAKVFDPFFTTKDVDKGTGLGLAISHGIVERHHGRIEVESKLGEGTVFRVILPTE